MSERVERKSAMMSCPPTRTLPSLGLTIPQMMLISVVLPAPLGPSNAKISPRWMSKLTLLSAWYPVAYVFDRFSIEMIGCIRMPDRSDEATCNPRRSTQIRCHFRQLCHSIHVARGSGLRGGNPQLRSTHATWVMNENLTFSKLHL